MRPQPRCGLQHEALVERDLAPFEREVEPLVRRLDARHLLAQPTIVRGCLSVGRVHPGEQRRVGLLRRIQLLDAAGNDDWHEAARRHFRGNPDGELRRRVGQVVRRLLGRRQAKRRTHQRRVLAAALADHVGLQPVVPVAVLTAERGGPHRLEVGPELHVDGDRFGGRHVEQHQAARLVERHQPGGIHREDGVRVADGARLGPDVHRGCHARVGNRVGVGRHAEREVEVVQDLERVGPRLEAAVFTAEEGGAAAGGFHVPGGPGRAGQRDWIGRADEPRHGARLLLGAWPRRPPGRGARTRAAPSPTGSVCAT